jgi:hypothetical protein
MHLTLTLPWCERRTDSRKASETDLLLAVVVDGEFAGSSGDEASVYFVLTVIRDIAAESSTGHAQKNRSHVPHQKHSQPHHKHHISSVHHYERGRYGAIMRAGSGERTMCSQV